MQNHLNLTQCKQFSPCVYLGGHSVLYAVRFTLPAIIDKPNAYIQDNFFDDGGCGVSASGFFNWLPVSPEHHNNTYFVEKHSNDIYQAAYAKGVSYQNCYTVVDLMLITRLSGSLSDEMRAINCDLNEFVNLGLAVKWEQISFFPNS